MYVIRKPISEVSHRQFTYAIVLHKTIQLRGGTRWHLHDDHKNLGTSVIQVTVSKQIARVMKPYDVLLRLPHVPVISGQTCFDSIIINEIIKPIRPANDDTILNKLRKINYMSSPVLYQVIKFQVPFLLYIGQLRESCRARQGGLNHYATRIHFI